VLLGVGAWKLIAQIRHLTSPDSPVPAVEKARPVTPAKPEKPMREIQPGELVGVSVLASSSEWVMVQAWGFVRVGESLPDGSSLVSWSERELIVRKEGKAAKVPVVRAAAALAAVKRDESARDYSPPDRLPSFLQNQTGAEQGAAIKGP